MRSSCSISPASQPSLLAGPAHSRLMVSSASASKRGPAHAASLQVRGNNLDAKKRSAGDEMILISCGEVRRELSNYIDDEVTPEVRPRIDEHVRFCPGCKAVYDGVRNFGSTYLRLRTGRRG